MDETGTQSRRDLLGLSTSMRRVFSLPRFRHWVVIQSPTNAFLMWLSVTVQKVVEETDEDGNTVRVVGSVPSSGGISPCVPYV